jgi:hypothetical protein
MSVQLALNDLIHVRYWCTCGDQASVNTVHYRVFAVATPGPTDQDVANAMDALAGPAYKALLATDASYNGVQVGFDLLRPLPLTKFANSHFGPGTLTGPTMGRQLTGLIQLQTANAGPAFRGRIYIPFPPVGDDQSQGKPTLAYLALMSLLWTAISSDLVITGSGGSITITPVIFHRSATVIPRYTDVDANTISTKFATQKRRGSFGRVNTSPV